MEGMTMYRKIVLGLGFLLMLVLQSRVSARTQEEGLDVVTTLNYLRYVSEQIGGPHVHVSALANPRQDPHFVTPTPRMSELANRADLFIENGLSLDMWAKNVLDASGNPRIQPGTNGHLIATINIPLKELPTDVSRAWGDIHPQGNPHVWLDPLNIKIVAENIAERLRQLDPPNSQYYSTQLKRFKRDIDVALFGDQILKEVGDRGGDILSRRLRSGDFYEWLKKRKLEDKLGGWMKKARVLRGTPVISYHKTYEYFADRFGLKIAGELEEKPGIPPPPKHRDAIVAKVRDENIKVILNDNFYSLEAAEYVAGKTAARVVLTYIDVGALSELDSYQKLITYLIEEIVQATSS